MTRPYLIVALLLAPVPALAQPSCLPHDKLVDLLDWLHSEKPVGVGLENGGRLLELFASQDGATWTMAITTPDGATCVIATGTKWMEKLAAKESF